MEPKDITTSWRHYNSSSSSRIKAAERSIGREEELGTNAVILVTSGRGFHREETQA